MTAYVETLYQGESIKSYSAHTIWTVLLVLLESEQISSGSAAQQLKQ
jgi:hypothetical protein